jgi:carboxyl-terminal processing protease
VFVLTGEGTCSASESIINGLRGVDVQVIQIGSTSCGKPYGFYPQDNCGTTYFSIEFRGINAKGFGDYADGFTPANRPDIGGVSVPGCSVADDFTHALGDQAESRFAAALAYRIGQSCPSPTGMAVSAKMQIQSAGREPVPSLLRRPFWRQNRILRD